ARRRDAARERADQDRRGGSPDTGAEHQPGGLARVPSEPFARTKRVEAVHEPPAARGAARAASRDGREGLAADRPTDEPGASRRARAFTPIQSRGRPASPPRFRFVLLIPVAT